MSRQPAAVGIRDEDPTEPGPVEHGRDAGISRANVYPEPSRVDRVGLDAGRTSFPRRVDDRDEQGLGDTFTPVAGPDLEAAD